MVLDSFIALWIKKSESSLKEYFLLFRNRAPALYAGVVVFTSFSLIASFSILSLILLLILLIPPMIYKKGFACFLCILSLLSFIFATIHTPIYSALPDFEKGEGTFKAEKLSMQSTFFKTGYKLQGVLKDFRTEEGHLLKQLPCSIFLERPPETLSDDYLIQGAIKVESDGICRFKEIKISARMEQFSWLKLRYSAQNHFIDSLHKIIKSEKVAKLLAAFFVAQIDDPLLGLEFSRLGLSHLLAISGFHFGLIVSTFGMIVGLFLRKSFSSLVIAIPLCLYPCLIGLSPSILRAAIMALCILLSPFFTHKNTPLNALGIALIATCFILPKQIFSPGMILSYLCTFALLFFYPLIRDLLGKIFPVRTNLLHSGASRYAKTLFFFSAFIKNSVAINISILLWSTPATLYYFHTFPILSLLYNLFIPAFMACVLPVFVLGYLINLVFPPLAIPCFIFTNYSLDFILNVLHHPPAFLDIRFHASIPKEVVILWCLFLIFLRTHLKQKKSEDFLFVTCVF